MFITPIEKARMSVFLAGILLNQSPVYPASMDDLGPNLLKTALAIMAICWLIGVSSPDCCAPGGFDDPVIIIP